MLNTTSSRADQGSHLAACGLRVSFDGVKAVDGVDLRIQRGEILGLIGPNGAGKTTLVNALTGFQRLTAGSVSVAGTVVTRWPPHAVVRIGLARTFQSVRLFRGLTVLDNVTIGAIGSGTPFRTAQRRAWELLERMGMLELAMSDASAASHGEERRIGIARALATKPTFLLLDEPAAGLNEVESAELVAVLRKIREDFSCGLMVIEHDMQVIMNVCERIQVIDHGKTISIGTPEQVRSDPVVQKAYLGTERRLEILDRQHAEG